MLRLIEASSDERLTWRLAYSAGYQYAIGRSDVGPIEYRQFLQEGSFTWKLVSRAFTAGMCEATLSCGERVYFAAAHIMNYPENDNEEGVAA